MKAQWIRAVDVGLLGPFMIWAGLQNRKLPYAARNALVITGAATVGYNLRNLLIQARRAAA